MNNIHSRNIFISVKDHSVSGEVFELHHDSEYDMLATFPQPGHDALGRYYESEDYISHTDAKRSLFEKAYHFVKELSLKKKQTLIDALQPEKGKLLDIGAGTGDFLQCMRNDGWQVSGAEPSEKASEIALKKGISLARETTSFQSGSFNVITMWHVLEHVPDPKKQIAELDRLLVTGGTIVIAVPNFHSYDAKHYKEYWAAYDVPRHLWHYSATSIEKLFAEKGFKLKEILPMKFDAFYVSLLSEKYKTGKMNYFNALITGLKSNWKARETGQSSSNIYILSKP
ncbi:MAG TPA: class I SAM-dependent methyltransferase [Flavobacterium sp.]|jgi:2-polyprenyl-3-methyl-5-hydroxy-6-metoxy-1,4-benzoquinol methylase